MSCGMALAKPTIAPSARLHHQASRYSSWRVRIALVAPASRMALMSRAYLLMSRWPTLNACT